MWNPEEIRPAFQPIVWLRDNRVVGHEALARHPLGGAAEQFAAAAQTGKVVEWDLHCIRAALRSSLPFLFVNLAPETVNGLAEGGVTLPEVPAGCRVVWELPELCGWPTDAGLRDRIPAGSELALDDVGAGWADLTRLAALRVSWVKVARQLVCGCAASQAKQEILKGLVAMTRKMGIKLVAEGIDAGEDLATLKHLGVPFGQGFLLGRPEPLPVPATIRAREALGTR